MTVNSEEHRNGLSADAAAWTQAAGSIIAIAGAAWLARGEARQAGRWRREQGEEAAWAVRFVLAQAQYDAQIVAAELTAQDAQLSLVSIRSWKQRSANSALAIQTMLGQPGYIHAAVVLTTCNAKILVDGLSLDLEKLDNVISSGSQPSESLVSDIVHAHANLAELLRHYDARIRGVRQALDRGADMLPLHEMPDWSQSRD